MTAAPSSPPARGPNESARQIAVRAARAVQAAIANAVDPPVAILAYHRVTRLERDPELLAVRPERFAAQLEHLRARYPVVPFAGDWRAARRPAVAITFDDGYADNLSEALPILERFATPATFFVATGPVASGREFWWDALARVLLEPGERPPRYATRAGGGDESWPTAGELECRALYAALHPRLMALPPESRDRWIEELTAWSGVAANTRATHRPLNVDEVRRLARHPLATLGGHTVNHPRLSALAPEAQSAEIAGARRDLEGWIGRPVNVASFPFGGRGDFDRASVAVTRAAGCVRNAANLPGCAHRWSDPFRLPRHLVRDWDGPEFERRLQWFFRT